MGPAFQRQVKGESAGDRGRLGRLLGFGPCGEERGKPNGAAGPARKERAAWANRPKGEEEIEISFSFSFLIFQTNFELQIQINLKFDFIPHNTQIICSSMNA